MGRTITAEKLSPYNNPQMKTRVILANGILNNVSNDSLISYFSQFGEVISTKKQRQTNSEPISRFAYISFKDIDSAERAVSSAVHLIDNQIVDVRKARALKE
jgi:RNA recognition motif-containing protein